MQSIAWKLYTSKNWQIFWFYAKHELDMRVRCRAIKKCFGDHLQYIKCELAHIISSTAILILFVFCIIIFIFFFVIGNYQQQKAAKSINDSLNPGLSANPMRIIYSKSKWSRREKNPTHTELAYEKPQIYWMNKDFYCNSYWLGHHKSLALAQEMR